MREKSKGIDEGSDMIFFHYLYSSILYIMNWKFDISFGVGKPSSFVFLYNGPLRPLSLRIK